jgi:hypothetical protein
MSRMTAHTPTLIAASALGNAGMMLPAGSVTCCRMCA